MCYNNSMFPIRESTAQTMFIEQGMNWKYLATISQIGYLEYQILQKQSR